MEEPGTVPEGRTGDERSAARAGRSTFRQHESSKVGLQEGDPQVESRGARARARETQPLGVFWQLVMASIQQELGSTALFSHLAP